MKTAAKNRSGFTLIEVMVVLALSSVLLTVGVMLFSALLQSQRQFSLRERQRREISRIDALLRSDAHAATAGAAPEPRVCELQDSTGKTWTYRWEEDTLTRVRSQDGQVVQRESFRLPAGTNVEFEVAEVGSRRLLHLRLEPAASPHPYRGQFLIGGLAPASGEVTP